MAEHCSATLVCLLSGIDIFLRERSQQERAERILSGQNGLHVYATEYWTDYLLSLAEAENGFASDSPILTLASRLARSLDETAAKTPSRAYSSRDWEVDARLQYLLGYPSLANHIITFLRAKSLQTLESRLQHIGGRLNVHMLYFLLARALSGSNTELRSIGDLDPKRPIDFVSCSIASMLAAYQATVRYLLDQHDFPGISSKTLRNLKAQLGISAFTCCVKGCPKATIGFATEKCLLEHELSHLPRFPCHFPGCQYPPSRSMEALRQYEKNKHEPNPPQRRVRRQAAHSISKPLPSLRFSSPPIVSGLKTTENMNRVLNSNNARFEPPSSLNGGNQGANHDVSTASISTDTTQSPIPGALPPVAPLGGRAYSSATTNWPFKGTSFNYIVLKIPPILAFLLYLYVLLRGNTLTKQLCA